MFSLLVGMLPLLLLLLAALPWLWTFDPDAFKAQLRRPRVLLGAIAALIGLRLLLRLIVAVALQDPGRLELAGRAYGGVLQLFLLADFFVIGFAVLLFLWPRGGAVALAAFREGIRQPMFWVLTAMSVFLMLVSVVLPYFTFGDDYKMMKLIGFDIILLFSTVFAVVTASLSISEEIEGRTAITLISKPLSRRQFLLGKFVGILLASLAFAGLAAWSLNWALYIKPIIDAETVVDPLQEQVQPSLVEAVEAMAPDRDMAAFLDGAAGWIGGAVAILPGLVICCCQVMLFLAIAVALATRLPIVVNLLSCLCVFFLGNLAPHLVQQSRNYQRQHPGGAGMVGQVYDFVVRVFDTIFPALESFGMGPAVLRDQPLPLGAYTLYVVMIAGYATLYSAAALFFGLILFEDRDLA
jgi:ABC-type transport system involved in multi-copper enzyme maturation permease subunit